MQFIRIYVNNTQFTWILHGYFHLLHSLRRSTIFYELFAWFWVKSFINFIKNLKFAANLCFGNSFNMPHVSSVAWVNQDTFKILQDSFNKREHLVCSVFIAEVLPKKDCKVKREFQICKFYPHFLMFLNLFQFL